jgi:SAM-dependent methyltransferase
MTAKFEEKQREWNHQARSSDDLGRQVARPGDADSVGRLVSDIAAKLRVGEASGSLLDVGCGNGLVLSRLGTGYETVCGIDYSEVMIAQAKAIMPNARFAAGEAGALPFEDATFERVLCYSIFHYFPDEEYAAGAVRELVRVCAPGGIVLIGDLLDKTFEERVKGGSNLDYERKIPSIHRYSEWRFYDLGWLAAQVPGRARHAEILVQPAEFPLGHYRRDLRIWL